MRYSFGIFVCATYKCSGNSSVAKQCQQTINERRDIQTTTTNENNELNALVLRCLRLFFDSSFFSLKFSTEKNKNQTIANIEHQERKSKKKAKKETEGEHEDKKHFKHDIESVAQTVYPMNAMQTVISHGI